MNYFIKSVFFVTLTSYLATAGTSAGWQSLIGKNCSSYNTWQGAELIYKYLRHNDYTPSIAGAFEDVYAMCKSNQHICGENNIHFTIQHYRHADKIYFNVKGKTTVCTFTRKDFSYTHFEHDILKCAIASKNMCLSNAMTNIWFNIW